MANRITPDELPWEQLKAWGITRERIEKSGNVDRLLYGMYSTPVNFYRTVDGQRIEGEAAVRVYKAGDDWKIDMQTRCERPTEKDYIGVYGVQLDEAQKRSLLDVGHAGSPLTVKDKDGKELQVMVSLNPETNRIVTFPAQYVSLPKEGGKEGRICGVDMTDEQKQQYLKGESVYLSGMTNGKGEKFDSCVQFSAYDRRAVFTTPQWLRESRQAVKDIGMTQEEKAARDKGQEQQKAQAATAGEAEGERRGLHR